MDTYIKCHSVCLGKYEMWPEGSRTNEFYQSEFWKDKNSEALRETSAYEFYRELH